MPPTVSRSSSQSKISDSFRPTSKGPKQIKKPSSTSPKSVTAPTRKSSATPTPPLEESSAKHLNAGDPDLVSEAKSIEANRKAPFVHREKQNTIHTILRNFDLSPRYGPCVGMTRMERYKRAEKMGLNPPPEVLKILETEEGQRDWNIDLFSQRSAV